MLWPLRKSLRVSSSLFESLRVSSSLFRVRSEFSEDPIASWDLAEVGCSVALGSAWQHLEVCRALNLEKHLGFKHSTRFHVEDGGCHLQPPLRGCVNSVNPEHSPWNHSLSLFEATQKDFPDAMWSVQSSAKL